MANIFMMLCPRYRKWGRAIWPSSYFILHPSDSRQMLHMHTATYLHSYLHLYLVIFSHHIYTHNVMIMPDLETCNVQGESEQRATCLAWFLHNNLTKDYLYCNTRNWLWWTWTRLNWRIENWKHDGCHHPAQLAAYLSGILWSMDSWRI